MRILSALVFCSFLFSAPASIAGEALSVPVGKVGTWVHLDTQDHRVRGQSMGSVALDSTQIRRDCEASDNFSGIIHVRPLRRSMGMNDFGRLRVEIDCLGHPG
jgi:hypothetical protein